MGWKDINNWPGCRSQFSISLLQCRSRFSVTDEPRPLMPRRYSSASSFQTGWIISSFNSNCTYSSLSPNLFRGLSPLPFSFSSTFSSIELYQSKLDSTKSDLSELDSDRKSLRSSQKSSFSLCFLKNLLLRWFS